MSRTAPGQLMPIRRTLLCAAWLQGLGGVAAAAALLAFGWGNDGLWFIGDAPRHLLTGVFMADLMRAVPADPLGFALAYYARYPLIVPLAYPPAFHVLEGLAFLALPPSPWVGKGLVLLATALLGLYTSLWGRRWLSPHAGWAGALVLVMPGVMTYANAVLLNLPAAALGMAVLYHQRRWREGAGRGHGVAAVVLSLACVFTYYPGLMSVLVALIWGRAAWSRRTLVALAVAMLLCLAMGPLLQHVVPAHVARNLPSFARLMQPDAWLFYPLALARLAGWPVLLLAGTGLALGLRSARWQREAGQLGCGLLVMLACLLPLPAFDERYAIPALPLLALAALLGPLAWAHGAEPRRTRETPKRWLPVLLLLATLLLSWQGPRPALVSGHQAVVRYLAAQGPADGLLFVGRQEANMGFYMRANEAALKMRLVLARQLLWTAEAGPGFQRQARTQAIDAAQILGRIRHQCGCRWVAWEVRNASYLQPEEKALRQLLDSDAFEHVASFTLQSPNTPRLDLFRAQFEPDAPPPADLRFPFFTDLVFRQVRPVELPAR